MANFLKLIRFRNLIFIAYIQFVIRQVVLLPVMQVYGFEYSQGVSLFWLLVAGTVLIAAGGYALNDYFDIKIDALNHPETQIVGKDLTRRAAMGVYVATTLTGIIFGLIVAVLCKSFTLAFIFVIIPGLLWFYSSSYKRQFLTGNIIVSFSSALTILTVVIFQVSLLENKFGKLIYETPIPSSFYLISGCFALFAFLTTWIREIVKDMEDEFGDREMECRTMPIVWGPKKTKLFIYLLILLVVLLLLTVNALHWRFLTDLTLKYTLAIIVVPLLLLVYFIHKAGTPAEYHQISNWLKIIMVAGISYGFIFYYIIAVAFHINIFNIFIVK